jgi:hypothetical protein
MHPGNFLQNREWAAKPLPGEPIMVARAEPIGYQAKFKNFIDLCRQAKAGDTIIVAVPEALGDTYDEMRESLNRLADAELSLNVVPRNQRGP